MVFRRRQTCCAGSEPHLLAAAAAPLQLCAIAACRGARVRRKFFWRFVFFDPFDDACAGSLLLPGCACHNVIKQKMSVMSLGNQQ